MSKLTREAAEALLYKEARLLDQRRYDEWLGLFAEDGLYWLPVKEDGPPDQHVSLIRDNALRREERVFRLLKSNAAHAQDPPSRTQHFVSNVEVENGAGDPVVHSSQLIYEIRAGGADYRHYELGEQRSFAARCEHVLRREGEEWRIVMKKMVLLNRDVVMGNLTFIL